VKDRKALEGVAWVVRNRVESPLFPNTYEGVIFQRTPSKQFVSVGGNLWETAKNPALLRGPDAAAYARALTVAEGVYSGAIPDPTNGALYFHSGEPTSWFQRAVRAGSIRQTILEPIGPFTFYK